MSVKIAFSGISDFLDLALIPIRSAFGHALPACEPKAPRKVVLVTQTRDGVSLENSVCLGELEACQAAALELMHSKRSLVLEGFNLEEVAALCFNHNYRWRFGPTPGDRSRYIIEPGVKPLSTEDNSRKASKPSSGGIE